MSDQGALYEYALKNSGITDYNTIEYNTAIYDTMLKNYSERINSVNQDFLDYVR